MKCLRPFRTKYERPNFDGVRNRKPRPTYIFINWLYDILKTCMPFVPQLLTLYANAVDLIPKQLAIGRNGHSVFCSVVIVTI